MNYVSSVFSELEQWKDTLERSWILKQQDSGTEEPYYFQWCLKKCKILESCAGHPLFSDIDIVETQTTWTKCWTLRPCHFAPPPISKFANSKFTIVIGHALTQ